jgi:outer membrane protein OmpA-like peptidoglycan-associated protein
MFAFPSVSTTKEKLNSTLREELIMSHLKKSLGLTVSAGLSCLMLACASHIQKADLPSETTPLSEVNRLEDGVAEAYNRHVDVLAPDDFEKAQKYLKEAKEDIKDDEDNNEVMEDLAYTKAYLDRANSLADARRDQVSGILKARSAALGTHMREYPDQRKKFFSLDDDLRDAADDFRGKLNPENQARLQRDYFNIETASIQARELGTVRGRISDARKNDASSRTPQTLRRAEVDLRTAENLIGQNPHNPERYEDAVRTADESSQLLTEVLQAAKDNGRGTSETVALQLVAQNRRLSAQNRQIDRLSDSLGENRQNVTQLNASLAEKNRTLTQQERAIAMQQALERARQEFNPSEAEVYQQGDKLLIRLKSINFATGKANLPSSSQSLLAKVTNVIQTLGPAAVVVEGHTDSTGSAKINQKISRQRAQTVANYLETQGEVDNVSAVGLGYQRPIASNKTKTGRAQNRRVDVIVTAGTMMPESDRAPASTPDDSSEDQPAGSR